MKKAPVKLGNYACSVACVLGASNALAAYSEPASYTSPPRVIVMGSSGYSTQAADDSAVFQRAIDDVAAAGGGRIWVPGGEYQLSGVSFKSNVHLQVHKNATLVLNQQGASVFGFGGGIENVSIRGVGGGLFTVQLPDYEQARFIFASGVNNLLIRNVDIEDPHMTVFSSIELTWSRQDGRTPNNVTIHNVNQLTTADYGYGITQIQAAENTNFSNLRGVGGSVLRLETGWKTMNLANAGGVFNIRATNITSEEGQAAIKMQPHTRHNGDVFANFVTAIGSGFALSSEQGGTWKYTDQEIANSNLTPGSFNSLAAGNVSGVYREFGAQATWARLDFYVESELMKVFSDPGRTSGAAYVGPSIGVMYDGGEIVGNVSTWRVTGSSEFLNPLIMKASDVNSYPGWMKRRPSL